MGANPWRRWFPLAVGDISSAGGRDGATGELEGAKVIAVPVVVALTVAASTTGTITEKASHVIVKVRG